MKIISLILILLTSSQLIYAALPPKYKNSKDLGVIVEFIKDHELILSTLKSIDFENYTVSYGNGCTAIFGRKEAPKPQGWVGPADRLEFKRSNCDIDY